MKQADLLSYHNAYITYESSHFLLIVIFFPQINCVHCNVLDISVIAQFVKKSIQQESQ